MAFDAVESVAQEDDWARYPKNHERRGGARVHCSIEILFTTLKHDGMDSSLDCAQAL